MVCRESVALIVTPNPHHDYRGRPFRNPQFVWYAGGIQHSGEPDLFGLIEGMGLKLRPGDRVTVTVEIDTDAPNRQAEVPDV